jgi:hypothetical protein
MVRALRVVVEVCSLRWALLEEENGEVLIPLSTRARARGTRSLAQLLNSLQLLATSSIARAASTSLRLRGSDADLVRATDGRLFVAASRATTEGKRNTRVRA